MCEFNIIANDASTNGLKTACLLCFTLSPQFLRWSIRLVSAQLAYTDPFMAKNNYLNFDDGIISKLTSKSQGVELFCKFKLFFVNFFCYLVTTPIEIYFASFHPTLAETLA